MSDHNQCCNTFDNFENESVKESDELLIDAVRAYPHLYNHKDPNFKNHLMKKNSWKEIALTVNIPVSECQIRWVRLRERFGKEKRQRELDLKNGNGISQRNIFIYYETMSFLNDHIKRRRSYTNVSNLKRPKRIEVTANKSHTCISLFDSSSTIKKDDQKMNLSMDSTIIKSTESPIFKTTSQFSNIIDEIPIEPCANFLTSFKQNFISDTIPASSSMTSLKNSHLSLTGPLRHFSDLPHNLHKSDESTRNSILSMHESTSSPAATIFQTTPFSRRPPFKKKNNSVELESSLILLWQTMHQRLLDNHNSEVTDSSDEIFAKLIVNQLERLPLHEKQKRQQAIIQILYEPYNS
ncbi:uncharacterized protein LOC122634104 [Vespula pensylvanica]|uniref:MADF domain-containing protein n=1 Tax=Vespula pensylvanica TaxID=30213 RepID=A0A834KM89_VESPE|nr:uncharacterized protein LOC122634104 [Vespula pensylvanica]KAF7409303.1 hypothetical protein H0235_014155 [Vespula pensylvanica]